MQDGGGVSAVPADFATADEVLSAIRNISRINHLKLIKAARIYAHGSIYADPRELRDDAISTAYLSASGDGGRRWPRGVDFISFLIMTMRGLASDSRRSAVRKSTVSNRVQAKDGAERYLLDGLEHATPSMESVELGAEESQHRFLEEEAALREVEQLCAADPEIDWVVRGIREGKPAHEIQEKSGMSKLKYDNAQKRWRRKSEKFFLGRRKS